MLIDKSIKELNELLTKKQITIEDLVHEVYQTIDANAKKINAFITLRPKSEVLEEAKQLQNMPRRSQLHGLPYILKDAYVTKGIRTTSASNVLANFIPPYSATVYQKLVDAGALLIGKMNMDAWGHGGSTENTDFGPTRNPWNLTKVAGGSSGGPAAALAARMAVFAIGEDTGGSIRNPAAWTNTTGLKVTYGRVSRYGAIAYASSFDTVGPMAKTAEDCAIILETIAGNDPFDATSANKPVEPYSRNLDADINGMTIGFPVEMYGEGLDPEIKTAIKTAMDVLVARGAIIKEIHMPIFEYGLPTYYLIGPSETSSNLARYDSVRFGDKRDKFTPESMRRILIGTYALSAGYYDAYYKKAQKVRTLLIREYEKAFSQCDVIVMPVTPTMPTTIGELMSDPLQNLLADIYTTSINPVGVPSIAIPCGFSKTNLPIGLQLVGPMFSESKILSLADHYQHATDWHTKKPEIK